MGRPKGLLVRHGRSLLELHAEALRPFSERVIAVIGSEPEAHRALPGPDAWVFNPDWATTWPADSLALALRAHPPAGPVWVQPIDTPPCPPATLRALLDAGAPAVPRGPDGDGHPVLLSAALARSVAARAPEGGLRTLLGGVRRVPVDQPDVAVDFDTASDWEQWEPESG